MFPGARVFVQLAGATNRKATLRLFGVSLQTVTSGMVCVWWWREEGEWASCTNVTETLPAGTWKLTGKESPNEDKRLSIIDYRLSFKNQLICASTPNQQSYTNCLRHHPSASRTWCKVGDALAREEEVFDGQSVRREFFICSRIKQP